MDRLIYHHPRGDRNEVIFFVLIFEGTDIPGGSTLIIDVELLEIKKFSKSQDDFKVIDTDGDEQISVDEVSLAVISRLKIGLLGSLLSFDGYYILNFLEVGSSDLSTSSPRLIIDAQITIHATSYLTTGGTN